MKKSTEATRVKEWRETKAIKIIGFNALPETQQAIKEIKKTYGVTIQELVLLGIEAYKNKLK